MRNLPAVLHPTMTPQDQQNLLGGPRRRRGQTAPLSMLARRLVGFLALAALGFGVSMAVPVSFASAQTSAATSSDPVCTYTTNTGIQYTSISAIPAESRGTAVALATAASGTGYWITTDNGQTFTCNMSSTWGSWTIPGAPGPQSPVVGEAAPATGGLYLVAASGVVAAFGGATPHGSIDTGTLLNKPIVGMTIDPATGGYWLAGADGGVFSFDAPFYGSLPAQHITPAAPIVGISATPDGGGYRLVGADGGVFDFGDAGFAGSMAGHPLNAPVVGITTDPATGGYWLAGADGGVFSFDAPFYGSLPAQHITPAAPIVGISAMPDGGGYRFVGADGGVFCFGDAGFAGSAA